MTHGLAFWLPNIAQPIGTVVIGVAGSSIALRQWLTANEKLRFDLFEKRFQIYASVSASLASLVRHGDDNVAMADIETLESRIVETYLFFGTAIGNSLENAATASRGLFGIKSAGFEFRMQQSTLDRQTALFAKILLAETAALPLMRVYIDFSKSGRPTDLRSMWHFSKLVRIGFRLLKLSLGPTRRDGIG